VQQQERVGIRQIRGLLGLTTDDITRLAPWPRLIRRYAPCADVAVCRFERIAERGLLEVLDQRRLRASEIL